MSLKRVLFVDDDPMVLQGLQRMLRQMRGEWEMVFVDGGEAALERMAEAPFDVVVSDMRMPHMNGAQLLQEVMRRYPTTIRLVLSGHADRELVNQCLGVAHQYISKPCEPEQLKALIRNTLLLGHKQVSEDVKRVLGAIDHLPSVPALYKRLTQALQDENVSAQRLGNIIQQDMAMTAKILKMVNSAFFGLRCTIDSPQEAVAYLGIETVKTLVLVDGIFGESTPLETLLFSLEDLWHHSMSVATYAKAIAIAELASPAIQEVAFVGGILHDVGILLLAATFPEGYDRVVETIKRDQVELPVAEQREFGVTHAVMGAYLLGLWGLPAHILEIVSAHHQPSSTAYGGFNALLAVHAADVFSGKQCQHPLFKSGQLDEAFLAQAGLEAHLPTWRAICSKPLEA